MSKSKKEEKVQPNAVMVLGPITPVEVKEEAHVPHVDEDKGYRVVVNINGAHWGTFSHTTKPLATKRARHQIRKAELGFTVKAMQKSGETAEEIIWSRQEVIT